MGQLKSFIFPNIPPELSDILFQDDKQLVVIGVIGRSSQPDCNKMAGFQLLAYYPSVQSANNNSDAPHDGQITFHFEPTGNILYVHFVTPFDAYAMEQLADDMIRRRTQPLQNIITFNSYARTRFARMLLFAIQVCHIVVMVETGSVFDTTYLAIFRAMKTIREKYVLTFLPKLLKNSNAGNCMGKDGRLCSPRFIFYFEKCLHEYDDYEALQKLEFDTEDKIYKMLRNEFIITNNSSISLFSIPRNKRFVYINCSQRIRPDPLIDSIDLLLGSIEKSSNKERDISDDMDEIRPFKGFAKPLRSCVRQEANKKSERSIIDLLKEHVDEAMDNGFDDSVAKYKGKGHFVIPTTKTWYDTFKIIHKIFIENPDNTTFEANDPDYKAYLENFHKIIDVDERFFGECCEYGLELAIDNYKEMLPHHYSNEFHLQKTFQSFQVLSKYARIAPIDVYERQLRSICDEIWLNGKQQCEFLSLRGNPCAMAKHSEADDAEHSSGFVYISTCNCGRTQGRRDDPYTIRQANYDFYQLLANQCNACNKLEHISFAIFEPSINDYRAAAVEGGVTRSVSSELSPLPRRGGYVLASPPLTATQGSEVNLSLASIGDDDEEKDQGAQSKTSSHYVMSGGGGGGGVDRDAERDEDVVADDFDGEDNDRDEDDEDIDDDEEDDDEDDDSVNEIVIKVGDAQDMPDKSILRQPSTTEYLPGMVHTLSPLGLLPQFPSWSLVCIGPSSVYSHNTGLPEHVQYGFLSGANFLLPWDVHVRLEHAASWAASYEKSRSRKKPQQQQQQQPVAADGQVFVLKIFIGCEYECVRGHRFIMNAPDKVLRGGSGIIRDSGSKVVFNDMPLYFPCPCRNSSPKVAQLMRVHVVTPKAPVNVILEPKVRPGGKNTHIFVTGLPDPPKLTQSAYWVLRLPYIYQGEDGPILPPDEITASTSMQYGCLMAGMYGISETAAAQQQRR